MIGNSQIVESSAPSLGETTVGDIGSSPAANDGAVVATISVTGGVGKVTISLVARMLPDGWTINSVFAAGLATARSRGQDHEDVPCRLTR
jgi:hypothetical protein